MPECTYVPLAQKSPLPLLSIPIVLASYFFSYPSVSPGSVIAAIFACALVYVFLSFMLPKRIIYCPRSAVQSQKSCNDEIAKAKTLLLSLSIARGDIKNADTKKTISAIELECQKILKELTQDPDKAGRLVPFLTYCLGSAFKLARSYVRAEHQDPDSSAKTLESIDIALESLAKALQKQLESLLCDNVTDINTEIRVLERMLGFYNL